MTSAFYEEEPPPAKDRVFLSELARLLILHGLDVDAKIKGSLVVVSCQVRTGKGARAGFHHEWPAADFDGVDPLRAAAIWSERFRAQLPVPL